MLWCGTESCREFESRRLHVIFFFSRVRAGDIMYGYDGVLLGTTNSTY